jgi:hypothetical protein
VAALQAVRRRERALAVAAAGLSVAGFLGYYLPLYLAPGPLPSVTLRVPLAGVVTVPWVQLLWCVLLTGVELALLTGLNVLGVHAVAVATGYVAPGGTGRKRDALLGIGLERRTTFLGRFGLDPFEGLDPRLLVLFNLTLRLKGWLGNQAIRYLAQLLLGRYAVRVVLDFVGLPLYMAINVLSVRTVLRQARVVLLGHHAVARLVARFDGPPLAVAEQALLYDTLQLVAVSKRDHHRNHYLLTRELLARFRIPREPSHRLPPDYLDRLRSAPDHALALCQAVILLGFVLDGRLSWRERRRLARLREVGLLADRPEEVARRAREFMAGGDLAGWLDPYVARARQRPPGPDPEAARVAGLPGEGRLVEPAPARTV